MIYVFLPQVPVEPIGGVTTLFDYVERLNELSGETVAMIVSRVKYIRRILPKSYPLVPVLYKEPSVGPKDTVIVPEVLVSSLEQFPHETRKYLVVLNWQYLDVFNKNTHASFEHLSGILTNSEFSAKMLRARYPLVSVAHISHVIDPFFRTTTAYKKRSQHSVLILNRKNTHHIPKVLEYLRTTPHKVTLVNNLSSQELLPIYNQHQIFVNLGYPEGFCRPAAEAMACGCVVVGFTGGGGSDFMKHGRNSFIASDGNEDELIAALDHVLHGMSQDHLDDVSLVARTSIRSIYTKAAQAKDLYRVFNHLLPIRYSKEHIEKLYAAVSSSGKRKQRAYQPIFSKVSRETLAIQLYHERQQHKEITSSKFFSLWQGYCKLRDHLKENKNRFSIGKMSLFVK